MKPSRDEFRAQVLKEYPGATIVAADRGLYVVVGTRVIADRIALMARAAGYKPVEVVREAEEQYTVRIFGFPRVGDGAVQCERRLSVPGATALGPRCRRVAHWHLYPANGEGGLNVCRTCRDEMLSRSDLRCRPLGGQHG